LHLKVNFPTIALPDEGEASHCGAFAWLFGGALIITLVSAVDVNPFVVAQVKENVT
jgi:hypothetical protein